MCRFHAKFGKILFVHIFKIREKVNLTYFFPVTRVDIGELRRQQVKLGMLRAGRVLLQHQNILRKILTQITLPELQHSEVDNSTSDEDFSPDTGDSVNTILQQFLMSATQPSPLKALFCRDELEAACLSVCQYLTASRETFEEEIDESDSDSEPPPYQAPPPAQAPVIAPAVPTVLGKPKIKKTRPSVPPPLPEVTRIMEMGFQRKQVEFAIKSLGMYCRKYS